MLTAGYCGSCGKAVSFNNAILFQGKTYCSDECKQKALSKN